MADALQRVGNDIVDDIERHAIESKTQDRSPRRDNRPSSNHSGQGYTHYIDGFEVYRGMDSGMAATYVIGNQHAIVVEYGGMNPVTGIPNMPKHYMLNALLRHKEAASED